MKDEVQEPTLADVARVRDAIRLIGALVKDLDFDAYLNEANRYDALAPLLDPSTWMQGNRDTERTMKQLAQLLKEFQAVVREHEAKYAPSEVS